MPFWLLLLLLVLGAVAVLFAIFFAVQHWL
jgi:hypothetical protein